MEISKPAYTFLWASGGASVAPSDVKIQTGWTAEVPPFQWENWSQNRQDQAIAHILQHGISVWDAATEYQAGKSYVQGSDGLLYKSRTTLTNVNPVTDTSFVNWTKATSGGLLNVQTFNASGTYTPTPGTTSVVIEVQGGGGAGGGVPTAAGATTAGTGGGGGGYGRRRLTSGFSGAAVTIGVGGVGVSGGAGGAGNASSFGAFLTAAGGTGGTGANTATTNVTTSGISGSGGTVTSADVSRPGGQGGVGLIGPSFALAGIGGSSFFSAGANYGSITSTSVLTGTAAQANTGGGGSGAAGFNNGVVAAGGNGGSGVVIVWEYLA